MLEFGSRQNMTDMDTKRAGGKCIANALVVSLAEFSCSVYLYLILVTNEILVVF